MSSPYDPPQSPLTPAGPPGEPPQDLSLAILPLRLIFWGGMLRLFDLSYSQTTNGSGFRFDILNDALGMGLILWGCKSLAGFRVDERYAKAMTFVLIMGLVEFILAIKEHFISPEPTPPILTVVNSLESIAALIAAVMFCLAMRWLCQAAALTESEKSWQTTTTLLICLNVVPLSLLHLAGVLATVTGGNFHYDIGFGIFLVLAVLAIPLIFMFISTSKMKNEIEHRTGANFPGDTRL